MRRVWILGAVAGLLLARPGGAQADEWRIATLAPPGSTWMKLMDLGAEAIEKATAGRVELKFYAGGSQGDEVDVIRKIRLGGLDGGALTSMGLAKIDGHIRVLQLPRLFRDLEEMDYVRRRMWPYFQRRFAERGYILGEPGDIGWIYFMSRKKISTLDELKKARLWQWSGDELGDYMFEKAGLNGVPLTVPAVLPALSSGRLDACFASPLVAIAMQWDSRIKYMAEVPSTYAIGANVIRKEVWDKLSAADRKKIQTINKRLAARLRKEVRRGNRDAKAMLLKRGIKLLPMPEEAVSELDKAAEQSWEDLAGKLYSKRELATVIRLRDEYRAKKARAAK